jgi:hypothetical protein
MMIAPANSLRYRLLSSLLPTLAVAVCVASCSQIGVGTFKLLYEHADWLLQRAIGHYIDLDKSQAQMLRAQIETLHRWHRTQELPLYADAFDSAAQRVARGLTSEDVVWMFRFVDERWQVTAARIASDFTPVVMTLRPDQRVHIAEVFDHDNVRYARKDIDPGRQKTVEARTTWLARQMEYWTGELSAEQRGRIRVVNAATSELPEARLDERRRRQWAFLRLVGSKEGESVIEATLGSLLKVPRTGADESYAGSVRRYEQELSRMILDLDRSLSARQRITAVDRLHGFARELRTVAAEHP